jgi:hypothetical protein
MIGVVFLREREQDTVELSYGVAANRRNRGIATDAVALVSRWCLDDLSARQIELRGRLSLRRHRAQQARRNRRKLRRPSLHARLSRANRVRRRFVCPDDMTVVMPLGRLKPTNQRPPRYPSSR